MSKNEPCFQSKLPHAYPHLSHLGQSLLCFVHKKLRPIHLSNQKLGQINLSRTDEQNHILSNNLKV
jgi:hypothetical protein